MAFDYQEMGVRIRKCRTLKKMSQEVLADKASVDRTYISKIETGDKNASVETVVSIAHALGVTAHELICDDFEINARFIDAAMGILLGCSPEEQQILTENMAALKTILKEYSIRK